MRTAQSIEEVKTKRCAENSGRSPQTRRGNPEKIKPFQWRPGQSGNPGGRPKHDVAREIARAIFENNQEAVYQALAKALLKGNAYVFKELADRAFGKMTEKVDLSGSVSIADRIAKGRQRVLERGEPGV